MVNSVVVVDAAVRLISPIPKDHATCNAMAMPWPCRWFAQDVITLNSAYYSTKGHAFYT